MNNKSRWLKRIGIAFGVIIGLLVIAAVTIPLIVNVDDYRPKIVEAANQHLNGKLDLGKLKLSLWGTIKVEVDGFTLSDAQNNKVVSAKDVFVHVPWSSLLSGAPLATFTMKKPEVHVIKDRQGRLNVMKLMKPATPAAGGEAAPTAPAETKSTSTEIPGIAARARLGVEMRNAELTYRDQKSGVDAKVQDLNVVMKDLSLSRPTEVEVSAQIDTKMGTMTVRGPAKISGRGEPKVEGGSFKETKLSLKADVTDLEILMPGMFEKKKGVTANAVGNFTASMDRATIDKLQVNFFNAVVDVSGAFTDLAAETGPQFQLQFKSNEIAFKPWAELLPSLKGYDLAGAASLDGDANGTAENPKYRADLKLKGLTAKAPTLKAQPVVDGEMKIITNQIPVIRLSMKAPGNDLLIAGKLDSFEKPKLDLSVTSSGMDLDQLVDFPKSTTKGGSTPATGGGKGGATAASSATPAADYDAMVAPMREMEMAKNASGNIRVKMAMVKAYGVKMTNLTSQMTLKNLAFSIDSFAMNMWNGSIKSSAQVQIATKTPTYKMAVDVQKLDLRQAVESQFELFKNTLRGIASAKLDGNGASFNPDPAKKNLNMKGNMNVAQATFATIDIGRVATEAITKSLAGIASKVPQLQGKTLAPPKNVESKYETVTGDFTLANAQFNAPNFFAKAVANQGLDIKGATTVGIIDYSVNASWEVIDTYNLLGARNLSVNIAGTEVPSILAEGGNPVRFPIQVTGNIFAPQVSYTSVPEALGKVALNNVAKAAQGRVQNEVKKQAENALKRLFK